MQTKQVDQIISQMTLEEKAGLCSGHDFWTTKAVARLDVPSVMMCDGPHGLRKQLGKGDHLGINVSIKTTCYPSAAGLASSFDRNLIAQLGEALGEECQAENVAMLLGPGLNMKRSPLCGRNFEYFSEDPYLAGQMGAAYIRGLQGKGVAACAKHFACNNQETRRMGGISQVDERTLHEVYFPAFEQAVKEGHVRSIMCAYNQVNGIPMSENTELLTGILRDRWGFDGFVVTDWGAVADRVKGLKAGLDLEMPGGPGVQDEKIIHAVRSGELDEAVLDKAVANMLQFILDCQAQRRTDCQVDHAANHALSGAMEESCAVLMKNDSGLLPLQKGAKVAFIGEFAVAPRYQGSGSSHINSACVSNALDCAQGEPVTYAQGYNKSTDVPDAHLLQEAVEAARNAEIAVLFVGLTDAYETEGCDRTTLALPANQNELIAAVAAVQPNTVVVLHGGAPVEMPWLEQVPAVLNLYLGGDNVGTATVRLLYGDANPSGKLAESWPVKLEDNPSYLNFPGESGFVQYRESLFIGYRYYDKKAMNVLFPFGHGLSYTTFVYSDLTMDKTSMKDTDTLTVSCKVKNTGTVAGKEVVQLYVSDDASTVIRPLRELKGFEKVELQPGEEKVVTFTLSKRAFAYYETKIHDWFVESGSFSIQIGASSRDLRLSGKVQVEGTVVIPVVFDKYSTLGDIMKTEKGRAFMQNMMASRRAASDGGDTMEESMGEGHSKAMEASTLEMPLIALGSLGGLKEEQINGIIAMLNA